MGKFRSLVGNAARAAFDFTWALAILAASVAFGYAIYHISSAYLNGDWHARIHWLVEHEAASWGVALLIYAAVSLFVIFCHRRDWQLAAWRFIKPRVTTSGAWYWRHTAAVIKPSWRVVFWALTLSTKLATFGGIDLSKKQVNRGALAHTWRFLWPFLVSTRLAPVVVPRAVRIPWPQLNGWRGPIAKRSTFFWLALSSGLLTLSLIYRDTAATLVAWTHMPVVISQIICGLVLLACLTKLLPMPTWRRTQLAIPVPYYGGRTLCHLPEMCRTWFLIGVIGLGTWYLNDLAVQASVLKGALMNAVTGVSVNEGAFYKAVYAFMPVLGLTVLCSPFYLQARKVLMLDWVKFTTRLVLGLWTRNSNHYPISLFGYPDNPNERIQENVRIMCTYVLTIAFSLMDAVITIILFGRMLWDIEAGLVFPVTINYHTFIVGHLLFLTVLFYALFGTNIAVRVGQVLIRLFAEQNKLSADVRVALVFMQKYAEPIAAYRGEEREYKKIWERYMLAMDNSYRMAAWTRNLGFFTGAYSSAEQFVPILTLAPFYFRKQIAWGPIQMASQACREILASLSLIVSQFEVISEMLASINRCGELREALEEVEAEAKRTDRPRVKRTEGLMASGAVLMIDKLTLFAPRGGKKIVHELDLAIMPGERVLLKGPSGAGKSSLARCMAGLPAWDCGSGSVQLASRKRTIPLTQLSYMIDGNLREQLLYPAAEDVSDEELIAALHRVNLGEWLSDLKNQLLKDSIPNWDSMTDRDRDRQFAQVAAKWDALKGSERQRQLLDMTINWDGAISGGEKQRLIVARALVNKVDLIIADEGTAALDDENALYVYDAMIEHNIAMLSVAHNRILLSRHHRVIVLRNDEACSWYEVEADKCEW